MKTCVVQLENHDDVISTQDKISWSKASRVLLVWPRRGKVLQRSVDLLLVLRCCQRLGAQLAVVTGDGEVIGNAHDLGIPVYSSVEQAQMAYWGPPHGGKVMSRLSSTMQRQPLEVQKLREMRRQSQVAPSQNRILRLALFAAGVIAFLALVLFFAPGASITLTPLEQVQQISLPVQAQSALQVVNLSGGMPAHVLSVVVEGKDQLTSSGYAHAPEGYASGEVLLTNLTDQEVELPAGTIVLTAGAAPARFAMTHAVQVPSGPGRARSAAVKAVLPGLGGNVAAGAIQAIEGPAGWRVAVANPLPISGGSERIIPAPTRFDAQKLREKLLASLRQMALEELRANVAPGQIMLDGSLRVRTVLEEIQEPAEGQPADVIQLALRVEYEAWYVAETDLQSIAQAALDANLPACYQPLPGTFTYQFQMQDQGTLDNPEERNFQGQLVAKRTIQATWSDAAAIQAVTGQRLAEAGAILSNRLALSATPVIEVYPPWWNRLPFLPARITLVRP